MSYDDKPNVIMRLCHKCGSTYFDTTPVCAICMMREKGKFPAIYIRTSSRSSDPSDENKKEVKT